MESIDLSAARWRQIIYKHQETTFHLFKQEGGRVQLCFTAGHVFDVQWIILVLPDRMDDIH